MTPRACGCIFLGGWGCLWPSKLFRRWCIVTKSECFEGHVNPNSPKNYIRLLGGLSPIHLTRRRRAKGLMWRARGPFPPAAAMVGYGCDGCWRRTSDPPTVGIVEIVYGSIFFYSYVVPIHSWHLTRQLNKKDIDLRTLSFRWFLCPGLYGRTFFPVIITICIVY